MLLFDRDYEKFAISKATISVIEKFKGIAFKIVRKHYRACFLIGIMYSTVKINHIIYEIYFIEKIFQWIYFIKDVLFMVYSF